jgi:TnpA family transposase
VHYYASLVSYYTIYDLRKRLKLEHSYLYLLCYVWKRYQQISDNLIAAFCYHFKQIEEKVKTLARNRFSNHIINQHEELLHMRRLAKLYIDDSLPDDVSFGIVRQKAFSILPRKTLIGTLSIAEKKHLQEVDFYWQAVDEVKHSVKTNLRHIVDSLTFSSTTQANSLLNAIHQVSSSRNFQKMKEVHEVAQENIIPLKLRPYLLTQETGNPLQINIPRYTYWIYRKLNESIKTGAIYLEDSFRYKSLNHELVSLEEKEELIQDLDIPVLKQPIKQQLDSLFAELHNLWKKFNSNLRKGNLKHLRFDEKAKTLHIKKTRVHYDERMENSFYEQIPFCDIVDVLRFVNKYTCFTSAFTHIQPRYAKQPIKEASLLATIIVQAMNNGNLNMSEIANILYTSLQDTLQSRVRLATLKAANDLISHGISKMSIYPFYSFDLEVLYGGVDGQKFEVGSPTLKARRSKKYFGKCKGVVAYTLLANHIPLQTELIGANEHESYFLFDIWYNNTTDISPNVITGDMHSINRANFAIMHWFGAKLYPRFTNIEAQLKHLYVGAQQVSQKKYLIPPVGHIDRQLIESEWSNQQRIIATLGLKGMTQSMLIKKLCTYKQEHRLRKALFEFDKLIRSIHTLNYLLDPTIQRNTHRSQNRVESYHQLRAAIAQAYGKKQLTGKTDIALEISNQCGRLIANAIIYYNSAILSKLHDRYEGMGNKKVLELLKKISPVAWQHIHFQGHLIFSDQERINLDEITQQLNLV